MRCVHGTEWNFCWECRAKQAEKLLDELRHEMMPLAEAYYLRDVRGQIEVLHDQIAGQQEKIERMRRVIINLLDDGDETDRAAAHMELEREL